MIGAPSVFLAFAAGLVSFVSPCCLPLVPGYLAAISGGEPASTERRIDRRLLGRSLLFVASFSSMFILLGLSATALGSFLLSNQTAMERVAGVAIILMGAIFVASVFFVRLNRGWHPERLMERAGSGGPVVIGLAFAVAWTPCIGPTLGAILGLASTTQSTPQAAALLAIYSAGLAIPFVLSAVAFNAAQRAFGFFRRHYPAIQVGSGLVLVAMGVLVLSGQLFQLNLEARQFLDSVGLNVFNGL